MPCERLAEHRPVLDKPALLLRQAVEPGRDECVERLRHFERLHRPRWPVDVPFLHEQPTVEEHAHGLDGIQRDALGPVEDLVAKVVGQTPARGPRAARPSTLETMARGTATRSCACRRPRKGACPPARAGRARARTADGFATIRRGTRGSRAGRRPPTACPRRRGSSETARQAARRECARPRRGSPGLRAAPPRVRAGARDAARSSAAPRGRGCAARGSPGASRARTGILVLRDVGSASAPSLRAPSRPRRRRRRGSGRDAIAHSRRDRRCTSRTPRRCGTCRSRRCP